MRCKGKGRDQKSGKFLRYTRGFWTEKVGLREGPRKKNLERGESGRSWNDPRNVISGKKFRKDPPGILRKPKRTLRGGY